MSEEQVIRKFEQGIIDRFLVEIESFNVLALQSNSPKRHSAAIVRALEKVNDRVINKKVRTIVCN